MEECVFCKIVKGEIPSLKVYEDDDVLAILDINPANEGHTLVLPKKHVENIFDIEDELLNKVIEVTKKISIQIKDRLGPDGINILQNNGKHAGQLVNHIHFHIIPRYPDDKVVLMFPREQKTTEELKNVLNKIKLEESIEDEEEEFDF